MAEEPRPEEGLTQAELSPVVKDVEDNAEKRPVYEVGFHIVPQVGDDNATAVVVEKVRAAIGDAEFISEGSPRKMRLAYTVERSGQGKREKFSESYFGWIKFAMERESAASLKEKPGSMKEIFRFIIVKTERTDVAQAPRRAVFASDRLEGQTIEAPKREAEKGGEVSEEELDKSLEALTE